MIFLISLALTAVLIAVGKGFLKKHAVVCYLIAAALSASVVVCGLTGVSDVFPEWVQTWVWPIFARSAFSTALFVAVMYAGAVPRGSRWMRVIMPIRGELSIIASILTLGHNITYGKTYFLMLLTRPERLPMNQLLASVCSLAMLCIMMPLFITSFKCVHRKMKGSSWKKLQRLAYIFYALVYIHVLLLTIPGAQKGNGNYLLTVIAYSVVFLTYGTMRIQKSLRNQPVRVRRVPAMAAIFTMLLISCGAVGPFLQASMVTAGDYDQSLAQESKSLDTTEPVSVEETEISLETPEQDAATSAGAEAADAAQPQLTSAEAPALGTPEAGGAKPEIFPESPSAPPSSPAVTANAAEASKPAAAPSVPSNKPQTAPSTEKEKSVAIAENPKPAATAEPAQPASTPQPSIVYQYQNGKFTGSGEGFGGTITVSVSIENDKIIGISVVSFSDDEPYWSDGKTVINRILSAQSANVDTVSGATFSSGGIIEAVRAALNSAKN